MLDLLIKRRSIRKYKDQEVEKEKLDKILKGALTSPSSKGSRPWDLIVVDDRETLEKLAASRGGPSKSLANAPLAIVVVINPELSNVWIEDASIISTVIQLIAESLGLGSCWIQSRERFTQADENVLVSDYIREVLDIPENYFVESMIAIGYPDEEKSPHEINLNSENIHYNRF